MVEKSSQDVISDFCKELTPPLQEITNLVYLASDREVGGVARRKYLRNADEVLQRLLKKVQAQYKSEK
jgi:hypothetical protein